MDPRLGPSHRLRHLAIRMGRIGEQQGSNGRLNGSAAASKCGEAEFDELLGRKPGRGESARHRVESLADRCAHSAGAGELPSPHGVKVRQHQSNADVCSHLLGVEECSHVRDVASVSERLPLKPCGRSVVGVSSKGPSPERGLGVERMARRCQWALLLRNGAEKRANRKARRLFSFVRQLKTRR